MFANNKTLKCTQCNAEFDALDEGKCPECGGNDNSIVTGKQIGRASCRERVSSPV